MKINASMDTFDSDAFIADLMSGIDEAIKHTAQQVPTDLSARIYAGIDPDSKSQRPNAPQTAKVKQKAYGHQIPLLADRVLADPSLWRLRHKPGESTISPPVQRADAVERLTQIGYRILGISAEVVDLLGQAIGRVADHMQAQVDRYVRRAR